MNLLQDPKIRVVIVVVITTVIAIGIGLLMSRILTPPPKKCSGDTHLDENINKCVPNCQDGYKNDPLTGECVINCPDGEVSSKSITAVTVPGAERCVIPCGNSYCDPLTDQHLCQETNCYIQNCYTTDAKASYCPMDQECGIDSNGKKKTTVPSGITLDAYGCYKYNSSGSVTCSGATPDLKMGTGAHSKDHVCCKPSDFGIPDKYGEPHCCPNEDDIVINGQCCPHAQQCKSKDAETVCLKTDEVCTLEGKCKTENATWSDGKYTGCCPFPVTSEGECYNMCTYVGTSKTGMAETCSTDADCEFKSGFSYGNNIPTAGGKCDPTTKKCRLYCGPADTNKQGDVICLNDDNSKTSTCQNTNTNNICKFDGPVYNSDVGINNDSICVDNTVKPPRNYWRSKSGAPILTVSANMQNPKQCNELSCLDHMATKGLLGVDYTSTTSNKQKTIPKINGISKPIIQNSTCKATIECNKMKLTKKDPNNGEFKSVLWPDQTVDKTKTSVVMTTLRPNVFNGSYTGNGLCYTGSNCKYLSNGIYAENGTLDGITPNNKLFNGQGCSVAAQGNPPQTYNEEQTILCTNIFNNSEVSPNYYCTSWEACCGEGGIISSSDRTTCVALANVVQKDGICENGVCEYNTASDGEGLFSASTLSSNKYIYLEGTEINYSVHDTIKNSVYLSLDKTMTPHWVKTHLGFKNYMDVKYSHAVVVMTYKGQYIGFNSNQLLGAVSPSSPINFYYTYYDGQNVTPYGEIPIVKGFFRFGSGKAYGSDNNDLGRPVRVYNGEARRDTTWGSATQFDKSDILTLVKIKGKWYLAGIKCFYWQVQWSGGLGINDGGGRIYYGTYNSSTKLFEFATTDPNAATPIDLKYVFSAVPNTKSNIDDKFLSGPTPTPTKTIIEQAHADSKFELTFSGLESKVKSSV